MNQIYQPHLFTNAEKLAQKTLLKKDFAICAEATLGLSERKILNALLLNAQSSLGQSETFNIHVTTLSYLTGFESNNIAHIKKCLENLQRTSIKWKMLNEEAFGSYSLIPGFEYRRGVIEYWFDKKLKQLFLTDLSYTKLFLTVQKRFKRLYSLPLYELCQKYFDVSRRQGETPAILLEDYRRFCGVVGDKYSQPKEFMKKVVRPAIAEINQHSDLYLPAPIIERKNRRIHSLKFKIHPNPLRWEKENPYGIREAKEVPQTPLVDELVSKGIFLKKAQELVESYPETKIVKALKLAGNSPTRIENLAGWLVRAIEEGWKKERQLTAFERPFKDLPEKERLELAKKLEVRTKTWRHNFPNRDLPLETKTLWVKKLKTGENLF